MVLPTLLQSNVCRPSIVGGHRVMTCLHNITSLFDTLMLLPAIKCLKTCDHYQYNLLKHWQRPMPWWITCTIWSITLLESAIKIGCCQRSISGVIAGSKKNKKKTKKSLNSVHFVILSSDIITLQRNASKRTQRRNTYDLIPLCMCQ